MATNYAKQELEKKIDETLERIKVSEEMDLDYSSGDLYDVIRWAKRGLLVRKRENQETEDGIFDYYNQ